jgi:hypothetical protein
VLGYDTIIFHFFVTVFIFLSSFIACVLYLIKTSVLPVCPLI